MKRLLMTLLTLCLFGDAANGQKDLPAPAATKLESAQERISYALGLNFGSNMGKSGVKLDVELIIQGIRAGLADSKPLLNEDKMREAMMEFEKQIANIGKQRSKTFLVGNRMKEGVKELPSGLQYKVLKSGNGATPKISDRVKCHYKGTLLDGTEFDSSYQRGQPAIFPVGGVIKGWIDALLKMKVGDKWQLFIPSELAYGEQGFPPAIGPNAILIFEMELLGIEK